jgi:hypothetical protein
VTQGVPAREPPSEGDRAIDTLSRGVAGELANLGANGRCPICDSVVVPVPRDGAKVYCSSRCLKVAHARREPLEAAA